MKLHFHSASSNYTQNTGVRYSHANENSTRYTQEQSIHSLSQQNIVNNYFQIFDKNHTETQIKNLIAARLQPAYTLPEVHHTDKLASRINELLDFTLTV